MAKFQCIQCGEPANELYRDFSGGIIKISHCSDCGSTVDKYIEYEPVIIYLDALLLKLHAFRHILINAGTTAIWKFTLVILLCEAFIKLLLERFAKFPKAGPIQPDYVFYSAFEWSLYLNYFLAALEMSVFLTVVILLVYVTDKLRKNENVKLGQVVQSLIWSHFGKVIIIPAMLWGQTNIALYLALSRAYTFASNVQALRVSWPKSSVLGSASIVGVGCLMQYLIASSLPS